MLSKTPGVVGRDQGPTTPGVFCSVARHQGPTTPGVLFGVLVTLAAAALSAAPQAPSLEGLLSRASRYVAHYVEVFSNVVAEEDYLQEVVWIGRLAVQSPMGPMSGPPMVAQTANNRRTLKSDLVLVNVGPPLEWRPYRDVFEVNGKPVRDRDDRLVKLFVQPAETAEKQALRIAEESARFNLGSVKRTLNAPGLALAFLQPSVQGRFQFAIEKRDGDAWIVTFEERARPTLFRDTSSQYTNADNPSAGRFWIEPTSGTVLKAEHTVSPEGLKATFTTTFKADKPLGLAVPVEMREEISAGPKSNNRLAGRATYGRFRKFEVTTETTATQK